MWANAPWRRIAIGLVVAAALVFTRWHWDRLTGVQAPPALYDSIVYQEIIARPLDTQLVVAAKPLTVPLIYRAIGSDQVRITRVQGELAFAVWVLLTAAVVLVLRRPAARIAAGATGIAFVLAAPRVGWSGAVLSESLDDTLRAATVACAVGLAIAERRWPRRALVAGLAVLGLGWVLARDTNAIAALVAVAVAAAVWPARRWWVTRRWAVAVAGLAVAGAVVGIWSSGAVPAEPLPFQRHWAPGLTSRAGYPLVDNVIVRMMNDRAWLAERGAPVELLAPFTEPNELVRAAPEHAAAQAWLIAHGQTTYLRWLLHRPLDRIIELVDERWTVLSGRFGYAMPLGWTARDRAHPALNVLRRLTLNHTVLIVLVVAAPLLLHGARRRPLTGIALCLIASGTIAAAAAYYGDAAEYARHCYGAGQQIVLGLFLALLAWLDRVPWKLPWRHP